MQQKNDEKKSLNYFFHVKLKTKMFAKQKNPTINQNKQ
jgi:hypothetical protein